MLLSTAGLRKLAGLLLERSLRLVVAVKHFNKNQETCLTVVGVHSQLQGIAVGTITIIIIIIISNPICT
jgi:hypothetical protein